ncbi:protein of unknown function [Candidatus Methylocalor cossyra]|uniref:Uncharacterized protein n=1 Tax=Candidatus Methylocalor cossyra TaxID=3108543 RepID=A0ABM9NK67_9GAMM
MPPEGRRRNKAFTTCSVSCSTVSWMRRLAAAVLPSTARKAFVMATLILVGSKAVTLPLRRMTRISPGAWAYNSVGMGAAGVGVWGAWSEVGDSDGMVEILTVASDYKRRSSL